MFQPHEVYHKQCLNKPGWFLPDEFNKAAAFMKMDPQKFFSENLTVDWWDLETGGKIFALSPGLKFYATGCEHPTDPVGECVFYNEKRKCLISPVRPYECALLTKIIKHHGEGVDFIWQKEYREERIRIANAWNNPTNQKLIAKLLGRPPIGSNFNFKDIVERFW